MSTTTKAATSSASAIRAGRAGVTEQAADAAVDQACRMLRLPTMRARFAEVADAAEREQLTYRGFLAELLMAECDDRDRRRSARRITAAGFPREKWLSDFDYSANPHVEPAVLACSPATGSETSAAGAVTPASSSSRSSSRSAVRLDTWL